MGVTLVPNPVNRIVPVRIFQTNVVMRPRYSSDNTTYPFRKKLRELFAYPVSQRIVMFFANGFFLIAHLRIARLCRGGCRTSSFYDYAATPSSSHLPMGF
jgi:hypothetical protein